MVYLFMCVCVCVCVCVNFKREAIILIHQLHLSININIYRESEILSNLFSVFDSAELTKKCNLFKNHTAFIIIN